MGSAVAGNGTALAGGWAICLSQSPRRLQGRYESRMHEEAANRKQPFLAGRIALWLWVLPRAKQAPWGNRTRSSWSCWPCSWQLQGHPRHLSPMKDLYWEMHWGKETYVWVVDINNSISGYLRLIYLKKACKITYALLHTPVKPMRTQRLEFRENRSTMQQPGNLIRGSSRTGYQEPSSEGCPTGDGHWAAAGKKGGCWWRGEKPVPTSGPFPVWHSSKALHFTYLVQILMRMGRKDACHQAASLPGPKSLLPKISHLGHTTYFLEISELFWLTFHPTPKLKYAQASDLLTFMGNFSTGIYSLAAWQTADAKVQEVS